MSDTRYLVAKSCTWHGPMAAAKNRGGRPCCPHCGSRMRKGCESMTVERFYAEAERLAQRRRGYLMMMRWSEGMCFPDFETMENAWRQAMEGME